MKKKLPWIVFILTIFILTSCSSLKEDWEEAKSSDTIESYEKFLQKHPGSKYVKQAQDRLEYLYRPIDWQNAIETNSIASYENYLKKHPTGDYSREAKEKLNELYLPIDFEKAKTLNTIEGFKDFIKRHPDSRECEQILILLKPLLYKDALSKKELELYEEFLHYYPNSKEAPKIRSISKPLRQKRNFDRLAAEERTLPVIEKRMHQLNEYLEAIKPRGEFAEKLENTLNNGDITQDQYDELVRRNRKNAAPY